MELRNYKVEKITKDFVRFRSCDNNTDFIYFSIIGVDEMYPYIRLTKELKDMRFTFDVSNPLSNIAYNDDSITIHSDVEGLGITFDTDLSKYVEEKGFDITYWLMFNENYEITSYTYETQRDKKEDTIGEVVKGLKYKDNPRHCHRTLNFYNDEGYEIMISPKHEDKEIKLSLDSKHILPFELSLSKLNDWFYVTEERKRESIKFKTGINEGFEYSLFRAYGEKYIDTFSLEVIVKKDGKLINEEIIKLWQ